MKKHFLLLINSLFFILQATALSSDDAPHSREVGTQVSGSMVPWSGGPTNRPWFLRTKAVGVQVPEPLRGVEWSNPRVAILLENGKNESIDGPIILQLGQLLQAAQTPIIVTGRLLYRFFSLRQWTKKPEDVEKSKGLIALIYKAKKRVDQLIDFEQTTKKMYEQLMKEQEAKQAEGADVQVVWAQKEKIQQTFTQERQKRDQERKEIAQELERAMKRYAEMKTENPAFDFSFYFKNQVQFDIEDWNVYEHPEADLYVLVPKEYRKVRETIVSRNPEYQKISGNHLKTVVVNIKGQEYFVDELATGLRTHNLNSINTIAKLFDSLGYGWLHMFTFRRIKEISVQALQEILITGSDTPEFNKVFDPMLTYMIGYGDQKSNKFIGLALSDIEQLVKTMAVFTQVLYIVDCNNGSSLLHQLGKPYMESVMKGNPGLLFIVGSIEEPSLYREIALLPHLINQSPLPFDVNKFFDELQITITAYYNAMDGLTTQIQKVLKSMQGSEQEIQSLIENRYKLNIFPSLNRDLRDAVNFVTPVLKSGMPVAATQIPFLWSIYSKIFLPLLGDEEEMISAASQNVDVAKIKTLFFEIADASKVMLKSNVAASPSFISLTPTEDNFTVIKSITMPIGLEAFLQQAIFSTQVFVSRIWRIAELSLDSVKYYDVTIVHKPYVSGWLFKSAGALGEISYKVKEGDNWRWYRSAWDFESNSMINTEEISDNQNVWTKDFELLTTPYQTWGDSLRWQETWSRPVHEGGASDLVKRVITEVKLQRDKIR